MPWLPWLLRRFALGAWVFSGCATNTVRTADYDRNCVTASDCAVVFEGDPCTECCNTGAVSVRAKAEYERALARAQSACSEPTIQCQPCYLDESAVACDRGHCVAR